MIAHNIKSINYLGSAVEHVHVLSRPTYFRHNKLDNACVAVCSSVCRCGVFQSAWVFFYFPLPLFVVFIFLSWFCYWTIHLHDMASCSVVNSRTEWCKFSSLESKQSTVVSWITSRQMCHLNQYVLLLYTHPMPSIPWMLSVLWTDSSQNGIQSVHHQINVLTVSSVNGMRNE